jgi:CRISPR/Cas system-associated exonuclease Cas4 (RecB family)
MPGPRWNRNRQISPTALRHYLECPRRARLLYIDSVPHAKPWVRATEVGNALHAVMERIANTLSRSRQPVPVPSLRGMVGDLLPEREYEAPAERVTDIDRVLEWAERGQRYITHGTPTILRVERHHPRHWQERGALGKVLLNAKADLMLRRVDRDGPYVEIIDYKSGFSRRWTQFTPILSSIVLHARIQAALRGQAQPRVRFSYLWFAHGERERIDLTRERQLQDWRELHGILLRLVQEEAWPMRPEPRTCAYCPYLNTACFPYRTLADPPGVDIESPGAARSSST